MPAPQGYVALDLVGFTDKGDYAAGTTYAQNDLVHSDNRIYLSLQDNNIGQALPVSPATETAFWKLWLSGGGDDLEALTAEDTSNVTGGGAGQVVVAQTLIDAIANKVMNDLVAKSQIINNLLATQAGNVLDATQGKVLKDELDQLNSDMLTKANPSVNPNTIMETDIRTINGWDSAIHEYIPEQLINRWMICITTSPYKGIFAENLCQMLISVNDGRIATRNGTTSGWNDWNVKI